MTSEIGTDREIDRRLHALQDYVLSLAPETSLADELIAERRSAAQQEGDGQD